MQSSGDENYERIQFTVMGDNYRFRVKACADVWITLSKIPGEFGVSRLGAFMEFKRRFIKLVILRTTK